LYFNDKTLLRFTPKAVLGLQRYYFFNLNKHFRIFFIPMLLNSFEIQKIKGVYNVKVCYF